MSKREEEERSNASEKARRRFGGFMPIVIGGVVLFAVYQFGVSSGRQSVERQDVIRPVPMDAWTERNQRIEPVGNANAVRDQRPMNQRYRRIPEVPANVPPVISTPTVSPPPVVGIPSDMPPRGDIQPMPGGVFPHPPTGSVYDRRPVPANPSELGLMPLQPLPSPDPAAQQRTTYKEPVMAPMLPHDVRPAPATPLPAMRTTSSPVKLGCDCGKEH